MPALNNNIPITLRINKAECIRKNFMSNTIAARAVAGIKGSRDTNPMGLELFN